MVQMTLEIHDLGHRNLILNYFTKNARIVPLEENCRFTLDSIQQKFIGTKKKFQSVRLPLEGRFQIHFEEITFVIHIYRDDMSKGFKQNDYGDSMGASVNSLMVYRNFDITFDESHESKILEYMETIINDEDSDRNGNLRIWYNGNDHWRTHSNLELEKTQSLEHIFLPSNLKEEIVQQVDDFIALEDKYYEFGISHKFTFLLEGKAGMGKTSIARSIAHQYRRDIYVLNLGNKNMEENNLIELFREIKKNSVLVIEDVDAFFTGRTTGTEGVTGISFSTLINLLDGNLSSGNGLITFITTNHASKLDKALIRPGRIDKVIHFGDMTRDQFDRAWRARVSSEEEPDEELFRICQRNQISMSGLMYVFFFAKTQDTRRNMARQSVAERTFNESTMTMYC
jgi:hypothetical protein